MPGYAMVFSCSCGFRSKPVMVGAEQDFSHVVSLCFKCKKISSRVASNEELRENDGKGFYCRKCLSKMMLLTDKKAWIPDRLNEMNPNTEPWHAEEKDEKPFDILDEILNERKVVDEEPIKVICPKCQQYSMTYEVDMMWD